MSSDPQPPMSDMEQGLYTQFNSSSDKCPGCDTTDSLVYDKREGEIVCTNCGYAERDPTLNMSPEWRAFSLEEKAKRSRASPIPLGKTTFDPHDRKFFRLRTQDNRSKYYKSKDRNISQADSEIERLVVELKIPKISIEETKRLYKEVLKKNLLRGRSISSMSAACLYSTIRTYKYPRTLKDMDKASPSDIKEITRCYRLLLRELNIKQPIPDPKLNVQKIASKIKVGEKTKKVANKLLEDAGKAKILAGRDPMGMAATALYLACNLTDERRTQDEIGKASNITEVTIRNRKKDLIELEIYKELEENPDFLTLHDSLGDDFF